MATKAYAIMAVDPGETTGVAQMHIWSGGWEKKGHPVVRLRTTERKVPHTTELGTWDQEFFIRRGYYPSNPYQAYRVIVEWLAEEWIRFRMHACADKGFKIEPEHTFLVLEDYLLPGMIKSRKREVLSPVYIAQGLTGYLDGAARAYEMAGMGPAHVGTVAWITPSERGERDLFTDENLRRSGLLVKPKTKHDHENAAIRLALAWARKGPKIEGLNNPFDGERPEPFVKKWIPSDYAGPYQPGGTRTYSPGDPSPIMPKRKKVKERYGLQIERAKDSLSDDIKSIWGRQMKDNPAIARYILDVKKMYRRDLVKMAGEQYGTWMWNRFSNPEAGWAHPSTRGALEPSDRLKRLAKAVLPRA